MPSFGEARRKMVRLMLSDSLSLSYLPTPIAGIFTGLCSFICTSFCSLLAIEASVFFFRVVATCVVIRLMVSNPAVFFRVQRPLIGSLSLSLCRSNKAVPEGCGLGRC